MALFPFVDLKVVFKLVTGRFLLTAETKINR